MNSRSLAALSLTEALEGVRAKRFSAREVRDAVRQEIAQKNSELNVFLAVNEDESQSVQDLESLPLAGLPVAVKDNVLVKGLTATASSNVLKNYQPHYDASLITKLRAAGGYIIGKTNMDAWAHGSSTETSDFGPTKNPLNPEYIPGGSSGGSAAAVAANLCTTAIGTETSGSIRGPAAWTGGVGLKPTYGRVSRAGVIAMASSLDCPGPMSKTVEDSALMLEVIAGQDKYDGTTSPEPVSEYRKTLRESIQGKKIGFVYLDILEDQVVKQSMEDVMRVFEKLGATVEVAQALDPQPAIGMYAVLQRSEVSSNLARFDGIRYGEGRDRFGTEAKRRIMLGTYTLSKGYADKYYVRAQQVRTKFIEDFNRLFSQYDVLISPTMPGFALKLGESKKYPFYGEMIDKMAEPSAAAGLPGISVPSFVDPQTGLALGINIMTPAFQEALMLQVAYAYEQATDWNPWIRAQREGGVV